MKILAWVMLCLGICNVLFEPALLWTKNIAIDWKRFAITLGGFAMTLTVCGRILEWW